MRFECLDAGAAAKSPERVPKQPGVRDYFNDDVGGSANEPAKKNNEEPIVLRAAAHEVHHGDDLENDAPGIEKVAQAEHG